MSRNPGKNIINRECDRLTNGAKEYTTTSVLKSVVQMVTELEQHERDLVLEPLIAATVKQWDEGKTKALPSERGKSSQLDMSSIDATFLAENYVVCDEGIRRQRGSLKGPDMIFVRDAKRKQADAMAASAGREEQLYDEAVISFSFEHDCTALEALTALRKIK